MEDVKVENVTIPAGMPIQVDIFSIHYDSKIWGPVSPFEFYPERYTHIIAEIKSEISVTSLLYFILFPHSASI